MKRTASVLVLCVAAGTLIAAPRAQEKGEQPEPKMEGLWNLVWGAREGQALISSKDVHWTIDAKGNVAQHYGTDAARDVTRKFTLTFDHKNRTVDFKDDSQTALGLYELSEKGNKLVICFNFKSKERPRFIDSSPQYGYTCYELRRVNVEKK